MSETATVSGKLPANLANMVADAIYSALIAGMEPDEACCVAVAVAADYARHFYGDAYMVDLAKVITERAGQPLPQVAHG